MDHSYSVNSCAIVPNEVSPDYMLQLDRIICEFMKDQDIPGASLSVYYQGKPFYKQGYGIARCGEHVRSNSYFRIASISKVITSIGILQLVERGLFTLDRKVFGKEGILTDFRCHHDNQSTITVQHLLQHSAGWDRDVDGDHVFWYSDPTHRGHIDVFDSYTLVQYVLTHKLAFQPGTKHAYSNLTYLILGMVIEKISGVSYEEFTSRILQPHHIDVFVGRTLQEHTNQALEVKYFNNMPDQTATSIFYTDCQVAPQYGSFPMENSASYGGLVTCAENLVKLLDDLICKYDHMTYILTPKSVEMMLKKPSYCTADDWYGLGIDVEDSGQSFGHTGAMDGTSTTVRHDRTGFTWALLLNSWAKDMDLDGVMKYALSTVHGYNLWSDQGHISGHKNCYHGDGCYGDCFVISKDRKQCVFIHVPHSKLLTHASAMKSEGYMLGYLCAFVKENRVVFNVIWNRVTRNKQETWKLVLDIKQTELSDFVDNLNKNKQSVWLCQTYVIQETIKHAFVIFDKEDLFQQIYCVNENEHEANFKSNNDHGLELVCQSVVTIKNEVYITAVYRNIKTSVQDRPALKVHKEQWTSLPVEQFVPRIQERFLQQFRLDQLQFYTCKESTKVSAIWTKMNISKPAFQRYVMYQRYNVSKYGLLYELKESMAANQPVKCLCSYMDEGVEYFVCIWGRYNRTKKMFKSAARKRKLLKH